MRAGGSKSLDRGQTQVPASLGTEIVLVYVWQMAWWVAPISNGSFKFYSDLGPTHERAND